MDFKEELIEMLNRYVPVTENKEEYESTIKILTIRIAGLHEKYKEGAQ